MPPHDSGDHGHGGHHHDHDGHGHDHDHDHSHDDSGPGATGLPVRSRLIRPGALGTGALIAAVFAVFAHFRSLGAGLVWDDRVFLLEDDRVRRLSSMFTAWGDSFFGALRRNEMYRPVVNASLAFDWWISRSTEGDPSVRWFHVVNLLIHAANAGLVYVFLANLTKRKLGAPLIAAVLWAVHPLAVEPVTWIVGRCDLLAAMFGLLAGILFIRSPGKPRMLWGSAALWGLALFAKASVAMLPAILLLGLVAYHDVEWKRVATPRIGKRFVVFAAPALVWLGATWLVLGSPFPTEHGVTWKYGEVGLGEALLGSGRAVLVSIVHVVLPTGLCGDYSSDPAWLRDGAVPVIGGILGWAVLGGAAFLGVRMLRRHPTGFPLLAFAVSLVPVLQIVRIGAITADRFLYFPMVFAALLFAELLEHLYYRWGGRGLAVTILAFGLFSGLSWMRAPVWRDDVAFQRDVLRQYPGKHEARYRLAYGLSNTGNAADRAEAVALLESFPHDSAERGNAAALLGAVRIEEGDLARAEAALRSAVDDPRTDRLPRAQACHNLAVVLDRTGRAAEAIEFARRALRSEPALEPTRKLLDRLERAAGTPTPR